MNKAEFQELIVCIELLKVVFKDDDKVAMWMTSENPFLGESKPINLFWRERGHKVKAFIASCIEEGDFK